jgi:hypothetical protein
MRRGRWECVGERGVGNIGKREREEDAKKEEERGNCEEGRELGKGRQWMVKGAPELSDSRSSHVAQVLGVLLERIQFEE